MSAFSYRGSAPDSWSSPRPWRDPSLRRHHYGKIHSMEEEGRGFFARLFRAT